ncbi:Protein of unknown function [Amycolatopsis arida]|uniref:DUF3558 domain-containing protein n=1 Tax=Amycolatopsis arida TaxID=587909 RepID=A0A1I5TNM2_9PSEU|nr:DUF3558 domain-containing protein [Amycolatopsis arida]TDX96032.1 uncharacterized protein DUF3558 [Amycolatopsis arida]SFP84578.1 Protein of unknown function [Amycolatopsis arida]
MRTLRALGLGAAVLATAGLLAACGGTEGGTPTAGPGPTTTTTGGQNGGSGSAPKVADPLDPQPLVTDPCGLVTDGQLAELGLEKERERDTATGEKECVWRQTAQPENTIAVSAFRSNPNGLGDIYDQRNEQEYFDEVTIGGYPAVFASELDRRDDGRCALWIGVTDQVVTSIQTQLDEGPDVTAPCPVAERTGRAVIDTLGG